MAAKKRKPASRKAGAAKKSRAGRHELQANAALRAALDSLPTKVMVTDAQWRITYLNGALQEMLSEAQADFRSDLPQFDAGQLQGASIDSFDTERHQSRLLNSLRDTAVAQIVLGGRTLQLHSRSVAGATGEPLGTVVEWADRTTELAIEREIQEVVSAFNEDDLTRRVPLGDKTGFHEVLARGINQLADNLSGIVGRVKDTAAEVARSANEISQGNTDLSQRTEEQASSLQQTASSMEQMTATVKQNADNAGHANQLASAARSQAEKGGVVVAKAVTAMSDIDEASKKIADIIGVIDEIAFQTNLLALNAAVEAARAGEQGRGFAVVASEVRNLAGRSATAAREIKGLIQDSRKKVDEGSTLVTQSGRTLEELVSAVKQVSDLIAEIAAASQEQSSGIEQVNKAVMQLDQMTQQNSALVEQASAATLSMADQARSLTQTMAKFSVLQETATAGADGSPVRAMPSVAERRGARRPWAGAVRAPAANTGVQVLGGAATGTDDEWQQF